MSRTISSPSYLNTLGIVQKIWYLQQKWAHFVAVRFPPLMLLFCDTWHVLSWACRWKGSTGISSLNRKAFFAWGIGWSIHCSPPIASLKEASNRMTKARFHTRIGTNNVETAQHLSTTKFYLFWISKLLSDLNNKCFPEGLAGELLPLPVIAPWWKIELDPRKTQTWKRNQLPKLSPKRLEQSWMAKLSMEQKQKLTPHGLRVQKNRNLFKRMFTSEIQTSLRWSSTHVVMKVSNHASEHFFQWKKSKQGTPVAGCQPGPEQGLKQWQYQVGPFLWRWSLILFKFQTPTMDHSKEVMSEELRSRDRKRSHDVAQLTIQKSVHLLQRVERDVKGRRQCLFTCSTLSK